MDLTEFLRARLDEDEQAARACGGVSWVAPIPRSVHVDPKAIADNKLAFGHLGHVATVVHEHDREHIARHDPVRVLAEVEAKRRILDAYAEALRIQNGFREVSGEIGNREALELACKAHAAVYAAHPDYRQEWTP